MIKTAFGEKPMSHKKNDSVHSYNRIAVVTGATSGIGEATARKLIASGFGVVGNGRNSEKLHVLEQELGHAFHGVAGDMADGVVQDALFEGAVKHFGKEATVVVANAGRGLGGAVTNADLGQFEEVVRTNLVGTLALMQKAAQRLLAGLAQRPFPEHAADIVVIGSVVGRNVSPFSAVYGATKFAIHSLAEGLRREVGPKGIRVSLVEPGIALSGFQKAAGYSDAQVNIFHEKFGPLIIGDDIARAIDFIVNQPAHVHVSDIMVRSTRQDYP
jgi:NADP-dependent 3-hydroxy acid dehydrogenase YdfG